VQKIETRGEGYNHQARYHLWRGGDKLSNSGALLAGARLGRETNLNHVSSAEIALAPKGKVE